MMLGRRRVVVFPAALVLSALLFSGCKDKGKVSAEEARSNVKSLVELAEKDVAEIDRGLPEGGK
jgi:outer membrane murein-binding lipoprotein Lpp